jgi:hypothetical protein
VEASGYNHTLLTLLLNGFIGDGEQGDLQP